MAQGTVSHLTYDKLGVLVTDFPAYRTTSYTSGDLMRVQSLSFGFTHPALDVKSIGSDVLMQRNGESPVLRQPDVNCEISYIFTSGQNEKNIGFHLGSDASIFKRYFEGSATDDINIVAVASNNLSHRDVNFIPDPNDFSGYNVIGFGNCFLTNYRFNASVGNLPGASLSYSCSNMKFDTYDPNNLPTLPSLNLADGSTFSSEPIKLSENTFDEHMTGLHGPDYIGAILPGDVEITITKHAGEFGGAKLEQVGAAIQNMSIDVPIGRQDIYSFGSNYVYNRKIKFPIIGTLSAEMILRDIGTGQTETFFNEGTRYDILIDCNRRNPDGTKLDICTFKIDEAQLKNQSYGNSIGDSSTVSSSFTFGVGASGGLKLYNA